jgi:hypothetical protein
MNGTKTKTHQSSPTQATAAKSRSVQPPAQTPVFDSLAPSLISSSPEQMISSRQGITILQRTIGNRAVGRMLQEKLNVGKPGDKYEQEADRVAEQVMKMPEPQEDIERKPISEQISPLSVSCESSGSVPEVSSQTSDQIDTSRGSGTRLSPATASWMGERMGTDFSDVRVHTDPQAVQMSKDLGAQAFTVGKDVYFGAGKYDTGSGEGKRLLAHELTHVVQQMVSSNTLSTIYCQETKIAPTSIEGSLVKDISGPVTDKSNSQFTLKIKPPPQGKYYYYRWSIRDAKNNVYRARSVDDNLEVWDYGYSKHIYINTPSIEAMLAKNAGMGCEVLCRILETDSPEIPSFYYLITETNSRVIKIKFDFLPPPNQEKIANIFKYIEEGKWDVDTLAAKLTDNEILSLKLSQRISLLSYIAEGFRVDDEDETTLIRLIDLTPNSDSKSLFNCLNFDNAKLYKRLEKVIDGENYKRYHQVLNAKYPETMEPEEALEKIEMAMVLPWASPGLIHSMWNRRFVYEDISINEEGKIHLTGWNTFWGMGLPLKFNRDLDPNELIAVYFYFEEEEFRAPKGKTLYMPAVNFLSLYNKQFRQNLSLVGDVAMLCLGGAGLIGATTKLGKLVAALELAFGVADFTINEFRSVIAETEAGREFLKVWDKISFIIQAYGIVRVALNLPRVFTGLRKSFSVFKGTKPNLQPGDLTKVEDSVNDVLKKAEDVAEQSNLARQTTQSPVVPKATEPVVPKATEPVVPKATEPVVPKATEPVVPKATEPVVPKATEPVVPKATRPAVPKQSKAKQTRAQKRAIAEQNRLEQLVKDLKQEKLELLEEQKRLRQMQVDPAIDDATKADNLQRLREISKQLDDLDPTINESNRKPSKKRSPGEIERREKDLEKAIDDVRRAEMAAAGDKFWGAYLRKLKGEPPTGMTRPHAHHIVFKGDYSNWPEMQKILDKSREILKKHGIDYLEGSENLVWAPNIKGQHTIPNAQKILNELIDADKIGTKAVIDTLNDLGRRFALGKGL